MRTDDINPAELRKALQRQHLTQQALADKIGCTKDTVNRWMRGKTRRVRSHLRPRLEEALNVPFETLTRPPEGVDPGWHDEMSPKMVEMRFSLRPEIRAALRLVALRYGIPPTTVMELAPLLFLLAAERSLLTYKKELEEIRAKYKEGDRLRNAMFDRLVSPDRSTTSFDFDLEQLEEAIATRDIFGRKLLFLTTSYLKSVDPLATFLDDEAKQLPNGAVTKIVALRYEPFQIYYEIAEDTLRERTGLQEGDPALTCLLAGDIDLDECLRIKRTRDDEGYRQWLREELDRIAQEPDSYRDFKKNYWQMLEAEECQRKSELEDQ